MSQLGNLDSESAKSVIETLSNISKDKLVIIVTHNYETIEKYATRKIKMHDGKLSEDKIIKETKKEEFKPKEAEYKNITFSNKIRLGVRNTFNLIPKFLLLFAVFLFITSAVTIEYSSFKKEEHLIAKSGFCPFFYNRDERRIIINKSDRSAFSSKDFDEIRKLDNIKDIEENDVLMDNQVNLVSEVDNIFVYGYCSKISSFSSNLDVGRMPQNENEVIVEVNKNNYYFSQRMDNVLKADLYYSDNFTRDR